MHEEVLRRFYEWVSFYYDIHNPKISAQYQKTLRMLDATKFIVDKEEISDNICEIAKITAILHDCGRFLQISETGSAKDIEGFKHAELGTAMLKQGLLAKMFPLTRTFDQTIINVTQVHSLNTLPNMEEPEKSITRIVQDAEKISIFFECLNDFDNVFTKPRGSRLLNATIRNAFIEGQPILVRNVKTQLEQLAYIIGSIWKYTVRSSYEYVYINDFVNRLCNMFMDKRAYYNKNEVELIRENANLVIEGRQ